MTGSYKLIPVSCIIQKDGYTIGTLIQLSGRSIGPGSLWRADYEDNGKATAKYFNSLTEVRDFFGVTKETQ